MGVLRQISGIKVRAFGRLYKSKHLDVIWLIYIQAQVGDLSRNPCRMLNVTAAYENLAASWVQILSVPQYLTRFTSSDLTWPDPTSHNHSETKDSDPSVISPGPDLLYYTMASLSSQVALIHHLVVSIFYLVSTIYYLMNKFFLWLQCTRENQKVKAKSMYWL